MSERLSLQLLGPSTGGIRRHVAELARGLPEVGWRAEVAGPASLRAGAGAELPPLTAVSVPSGPRPSELLRARAAVRFSAARADLVHAHGLKAGWVAVLAQVGQPIVLTVHNLVLDEAAGRSAGLLRRMERWLPGRVDAVIAVSEEIAARFGGASDTLWVVPPVGPPPRPAREPQAVRRSLGIAPDAPLVVSVARLHPQKDVVTLIDASALLRAEMPDVRVVIVGEGPLERELQAHIDLRGLTDTVLLAGPSANAADELAAADVVAITSLWEGAPLVAAEALLLGRPLISTPVGDIPRLVEDGVTGRLVPVGDANGFARAIARSFRDPTSGARMAEAGRQRAEELLGPQHLVAAVARVYDAVLARRRASR